MIVRNREDYYSQAYVQFEIIRQLKYKYLSATKKVNGKNVLTRYYLGYSKELLFEYPK